VLPVHLLERARRVLAAPFRQTEIGMPFHGSLD
jgi:hypothetical protein